MISRQALPHCPDCDKCIACGGNKHIIIDNDVGRMLSYLKSYKTYVDGYILIHDENDNWTLEDMYNNVDILCSHMLQSDYYNQKKITIHSIFIIIIFIKVNKMK